jgi:predicted transcriptional regulator YheO
MPVIHAFRWSLDDSLELIGRLVEIATKAMLANPDIGVTQIAHRLGISPATLYRYIPAARTANLSDF